MAVSDLRRFIRSECLVPIVTSLYVLAPIYLKLATPCIGAILLLDETQHYLTPRLWEFPEPENNSTRLLIYKRAFGMSVEITGS